MGAPCFEPPFPLDSKNRVEDGASLVVKYRHDGGVWGCRCVGYRCAIRRKVVGVLFGSRSCIPISLCRYVQFLVWRSQAGLARVGALRSGFQILPRGSSLLLGCGYQGDTAPSPFFIDGTFCGVTERRAEKRDRVAQKGARQTGRNSSRAQESQ